MPLLKRKPFPLLESPDDLKPTELVYQVRFTKEIFRNYREYLDRINLYRQRVWTCKVTGKSNLTYEEALVSERHGTERVQHIPKELITPILQIVQFSMHQLLDLVNIIASRFRDRLSEGDELFGKKDGCVCPCKIAKILVGIDGKPQYEVEWLDKDGKVTGKSASNGDDLILKKLPITREVLKSFIRESTRQNAPWVLHDKLAKKHGISTDLPQDLQRDFVFQDGYFVRKKMKKSEDSGKDSVPSGKALENGKLIKTENNAETDDKKQVNQIRYPIDDLLLQPPGDESRPSPAKDFSVPMESVGTLLMVWDFCSSFGRFLNLSPFSLEDFENAICHKGSNVALIAESHASFLRLLIKDEGEYYMALQAKKRKSKVTLITWVEYLCDFLDMVNVPELSHSIPTMRRGHYGLLDVQVKLNILSELVKHTLGTDLLRHKLDENIQEQHVLAATRRGKLQEARKRREEEHIEEKPLTNGHCSPARNPSMDGHSELNGISEKENGDKAFSTKEYSELNGTSEKENEDQTFPTKVQTSKQNRLKREREEHVGDKGRKNEFFEREMEKRIIRVNPLGKDRDYNRYWLFRREGRIFIETNSIIQWGYYSTKEELDAFMHSLNCNGLREKALHKQFTKHYGRICHQMQKRSREESKKAVLEDVAVRRSSRIKAPPRANPALAFLEYTNKWKDDGAT